MQGMLEEVKKRVEPAMFKISYGLYIVGSVMDGKLNAQTCNTVFQITNDPIRVAVGLNRKNLTNEYVKSSGVLSICILGQKNVDLVRLFGYKSGRDVDKLKDVPFTSGVTGAPIVNDCLAYIEGKVDPGSTIEVGTHTLFIVDVVGGELRDKTAEPMTYAYFRQSKQRPQQAEGAKQTKRWECKTCKLIVGGSEPPYRCDQCGSPSSKFIMIS